MKSLDLDCTIPVGCISHRNAKPFLTNAKSYLI
jgi:hypothetical protein